MDDRRFEALIRVFSQTASRRGAVRGLLALAAAGFAVPAATDVRAAGLGAFCTDHAHCAPVGADAGWATCRGAACCLVRGSRCTHHGECCDGEACLAPGVCGGAGASGLFPGAWCPPGGAACSTHPMLGPVSPICADNGLWDDGPTNCCFLAGGDCGADAECCAGLVCVSGACA